ncbi:YuzD family protein [Halalkalibacterium ligniniphilum]|uniref:YuzD family protein n=1 Tax=Halalkalibacterium ligniniphilum TaxID=1134413 RepID=UPI00034954E6|nr:YuzD family protein [Halalkalibacterium ligniniphilum]
MEKPIEIVIFGAEVKCASCINLPSALETMEWLEAAVGRKYPEKELQFRYVDIHQATDKDEAFAKAILEEEYMYPLVVIENDVVAEGNPKLKDIYNKIESL